LKDEQIEKVIKVVPTAEGNRLVEIGFCELDTNHILLRFMLQVLVPTLLMRLHAFWKYYKRDPLDYKEYGTFIYLFYNAMYGVWAIFNICTFFHVSSTCKELRSLSMVNYQLALIFGCFPAVNVLFAVSIAMVLLPLGLYSAYSSYSKR